MMLFVGYIGSPSTVVESDVQVLVGMPDDGHMALYEVCGKQLTRIFICSAFYCIAVHCQSLVSVPLYMVVVESTRFSHLLSVCEAKCLTQYIIGNLGMVGHLSKARYSVETETLGDLQGSLMFLMMSALMFYMTFYLVLCECLYFI